jgi:hypothetical protein
VRVATILNQSVPAALNTLNRHIAEHPVRPQIASAFLVLDKAYPKPLFQPTAPGVFAKALAILIIDPLHHWPGSNAR